VVDPRPVTTLPADREPTLRVLPMPADANHTGDIFGGWIMAQVDLAGAVPAMRVAQGRVATVAVNSFVFKQPVFVGDIVSLYADIVRIGRTSITVSVEVYAQHRGAADAAKVTEAVLTYVAVDENRRPRVVSAQQ
jgi:acyl-CoA thioesterase YciA